MQSDSEILNLLRLKKYQDIVSYANSSLDLVNVPPNALSYFFEAALALQDSCLLASLFDASIARLLAHPSLFNGTLPIYCLSYIRNSVVRSRWQAADKLLLSASSVCLPSYELLKRAIQLYRLTSKRDISGYVELKKDNHTFFRQVLTNQPHLSVQPLFSLSSRCAANYFLPPHDSHSLPDILSAVLRSFHDAISAIEFINPDNLAIISVDYDYFQIFFARIVDLVKSNPGLYVWLVVVDSTVSSSSSVVSLCTSLAHSRILLSRTSASPFFPQLPQKTYSACARYFAACAYIMRTNRSALILDADLQLEDLDIVDLIAQCKNDQAVFPQSVLMFVSPDLDYQSKISAGMHFASNSNPSFYQHVVSHMINSFETNTASWGIDQASLVVGMANSNLQPLSMPALGEYNSQSTLWEISQAEQQAKALARMC